MPFDRKIYFDAVRRSMFGGAMSQEQVDGQNVFLDRWEAQDRTDELRWLAYMLATTFHETAATMQPIEEYGKGAGHTYGVPDPETGQTYYGRGYVQLTWRDNYARATNELDLIGANDLEWHADRALDPRIACDVIFRGMAEGWFTSHRLDEYFSATRDDPIGARNIVNPGDKAELIASYHDKFLDALEDASIAAPGPQPQTVAITITVDAPPGIVITVNGRTIPPPSRGTSGGPNG